MSIRDALREPIHASGGGEFHQYGRFYRQLTKIQRNLSKTHTFLTH